MMMKIEPIKRKRLVINPVKRKRNKTQPQNLINDTISNILKTFGGMICNIVISFSRRFPILNDAMLIEDITSSIKLKLINSIKNRVIYLHRANNKQLNKMIKKVSVNIILDYLREIKRSSYMKHISIGAFCHEEESKVRKVYARENGHLFLNNCVSEYIHAFTNVDELIEMTEICELIYKELLIYNQPGARLFRRLLQPNCKMNLNNPRVVNLKKEVIEILKHSGYM